jgi:hypothetical protein
MNAHYLHGGARWALLPALSAAGGAAMAFQIGKGPDPWTWRMGLAAGLAVGLAVAITPKFSLAPLVALALGVLGALVVGLGGSRSASDILQGLVKPEPVNIILPAVTALPAFFNAFRLSEGMKWAWVNMILQGAVGFLIPATLWWFNEPVEMENFVPFLILAAAQVAAVEIPAYISPRQD